MPRTLPDDRTWDPVQTKEFARREHLKRSGARVPGAKETHDRAQFAAEMAQVELVIYQGELSYGAVRGGALKQHECSNWRRSDRSLSPQSHSDA